MTAGPPNAPTAQPGCPPVPRRFLARVPCVQQTTEESRVKTLTAYRTLPYYGDVCVMLANGPGQRHFVGLPTAGDAGDRYLFVEIDRVALLELERGEVSLYSILTERAIGLVFETADFVTADGAARPTEVAG